jgi:hypothetical protein
MERDLRKGVGVFLDFLAPLVEPAGQYEWSGPDHEQAVEFLRRAVVIRQYEAMQAILRMVDAGFGHFGVTLLRPAFEELVWLEYLKAHDDVGRELVVLLARTELADGLKAQNDYVGTKVMHELGFSQRFVKVQLARNRETEASLRAIGKRLGWRSGQTLPSMSFLSQKVGRQREYSFLYQGTSRYVHFSVQELLRRGWGRKGFISISSKHLSEYWQHFVMYWGVRLLLDTVIVCEDLLARPDQFPKEKADEMLKC